MAASHTYTFMLRYSNGRDTWNIHFAKGKIAIIWDAVGDLVNVPAHRSDERICSIEVS